VNSGSWSCNAVYVCLFFSQFLTVNFTVGYSLLFIFFVKVIETTFQVHFGFFEGQVIGDLVTVR